MKTPIRFLAVASLTASCLLVTAGCQTDNEDTADITGLPPAPTASGAPPATEEDYAKQQAQQGGGTMYGAGSGYPGAR